MNIFKMAITFLKIVVLKKLKKEKNGMNLSFLVVLIISACDIAMHNNILRVVVNYLMYTISV
jgi:hypothetical protein